MTAEEHPKVGGRNIKGLSIDVIGMVGKLRRNCKATGILMTCSGTLMTPEINRRKTQKHANDTQRLCILH